MSQVKPDMILTPSLSVILFTLDTEPQPAKMECCRQTFGKSPWKFHHVTELNTTQQRSKRVNVRQEYYELMPDLPLFSMSPVHFGKQMLRINIISYNHSEMVKFYSLLFGLSPTAVREDFCYFTFNYSKTLTLQLSLKGCEKLMPYPTNGADLVICLPSIPPQFEVEEKPNGTKHLCDPDNNTIIVNVTQEKGLNILQNHSSKSAQVEGTTKVQETILNTSHSDSMESDITQKIKDIELEEKNWAVDKLSESRPDVIPKEDRLLAAARLRPSGPTVRKLGRSRSPANPARKLTFQTKSMSLSGTSGQEMNNNNKSHKRNESVDIVASF